MTYLLGNQVLYTHIEWEIQTNITTNLEFKAEIIPFINSTEESLTSLGMLPSLG